MPNVHRYHLHRSKKQRRTLAFAGTLLLSFSWLILSGCSSTPPPEPEAKELPSTKGSSLVDSSSEEGLFNNAKRLYVSGLYSVAKDAFQSLATNYALGPYGEFAEIKSADAEFLGGDMSAAATAYEAFATNRPSSSSVPYALLRGAQCYKLAFQGTGRDPASLEKSLALCEKLISRFPSSPYSGVARQVRLEALREIVEHERQIAQFYARQEDQKAYAAREAALATKWDPLVRASEDAATTPALVPQPLPLADDLAKVEPAAAPVATTEEADTLMAGVQVETAQTMFAIERATCSGNMIFLYLKAPFSDLAFLKAHHQLDIAAGTPLTIALPDAGSEGIELDCFGSKDLSISRDGVVTLQPPPASTATLMALEQPPRLVIVIAQ